MKHIKFITIALLALSTAFNLAAKAGGRVLYNYPILGYVDGDTIKIQMTELPPQLQKISIRVNGVDTPEKSWRAKCEKERKLAEKASKFTQDQINKANSVQFSIDGYGKYGGRALGDVYLDGRPLSKMLIDKGYAVEYHGDKKPSWCD